MSSDNFRHKLDAIHRGHFYALARIARLALLPRLRTDQPVPYHDAAGTMMYLRMNGRESTWV